jgi:hypothetical protein
MHFFIEPSNTYLGGTNTAFGPISSTNEFKVSVDLDLNLSIPVGSSNERKSKAYACQSGFILIQETADPDLVNVILKPDSLLSIDFTPVKYYVYRGIARDSFFDGTNIYTATAPGNSAALTKFWLDWNLIATDLSLGTPTQENIGYIGGLTVPGTTAIATYFAQNTGGVRAMRVSAGDWFGDWMAKPIVGNTLTSISFEIILENDVLALDLNYFKTDTAIIDVSTEVAAVASTSGSAQDQAKFDLKVARSKVLAYADPAAFFGMYYKQGIEAFDSSQGSQGDWVTLKQTDLYNDLLSLFSNKNRLYLDIQSERGYDYNFYDNYIEGSTSTNIQLQSDTATTFTKYNYNKDSWPIFFIDGMNTTTGRFELQLRTDDNAEPLLYIKNSKQVKRGRVNNPFLRKPKLKRTPDTGWTKDIRLKTYIEGTSTVPNYIQIHFFREEGPSTSNTVPSINDEPDSFFGNIQLAPPTSSIVATDPLKSNQSLRLQLVNGDKFSYVAYPELYKDTSQAIFVTRLDYGISKLSNKKTGNRWPQRAVEGNGAELIDSVDFPKGVKFNKTVILENTASSGPPAYTQTTHVLDIANCDDLVAARREDLLVLALTAAEHDTLLTLTASLSNNHGQFLMLDQQGDVHRDGLGIQYRKYELKVQGLDASGTVATVTSTIVLYSFNGRVFASDAFATAANIPLALPDPNSLKPWKYVGTAHYENSGALVSVPDIGSHINTISPEIRLSARLFYPADNKNQVGVNGLSAALTDYPVIVVVHGNGHDYTTYDNLLTHLAHNGFIAASIDCQFVEDQASFSLINIGVNIFIFFINGAVFRYRNIGIGFIEEWDPTLMGGAGGFKPPVSLSTTPFTPDVPNLTISLASGSLSITERSHGMAALGRANTLFRHLDKINTDFTGKVQNSIGIIGHSRGGEAVLIAKRLIGLQDGTNGIVNLTGFNNIEAIFSLGPTDQYEIERLGNQLPPPRGTVPIADLTAPYFVLYGSHDGDLSSSSVRFVDDTLGVRTDPYNILMAGNTVISGTGFSLWDRANNVEKYMAFMKGATHNGFVTKNKVDYNKIWDPMIEELVGSRYIPKTDKWREAIALRGKKTHPDDFVAKEKIQRNVLHGLTTAFFRCYLNQEDFWKPLLRGDILPDSMIDKDATISFQYQNIPGERQEITVLGTPENVLTDGSATGVLKTTDSSTYSTPTTISLASNIVNALTRLDGYLDYFSPQSLPAILLDLSITNTLIIHDTSSPSLDASNFTHLSFRIAKVFNYERDPMNPTKEIMPLAIANLQHVTIQFNGNNSLSVPFSKTIQEPIRRYDRTKYPRAYLPHFYYEMVINGELVGVPPLSSSTPSVAEIEAQQNIADALIVSKTKSVMVTTRIDLDRIVGLNKAAITDIEINFGTSAGLVALDNFELTN